MTANTKELVKQKLQDISPRYRARKVKNDIAVVEYLNSVYPGVKINMQIHCILTDQSPYCKICGSVVKTAGKQTCSVECREKSKKNSDDYFANRNAKSKSTLLERYGVDNPAKSTDIQQKRLATLIKKYNDTISPKSRVALKNRVHLLNSKGRETIKRKYGVDNAGQIPGHGIKSKETMIKRYGVTHMFHTNHSLLEQEQCRISKFNELSPSTIQVKFTQPHTDVNHANPNRRITFFCEICKKTYTTPSETFKWRVRETGTPCSKCAGIRKGSVKEREVKDFVKSLGFEINENTKIFNGQEADIYIPACNIAIEFHGLYWHSDFRVGKNYHLDKYVCAKNMNISLVQIFEDEWQHKKDIVKSYLRDLLGQTQPVIRADNCSVEIITQCVADDFLEKYHICGKSCALVNLGLMHNNELISVMSFSSHATDSENTTQETWELTRFSTKDGVDTHSAIQKLFFTFVKLHTPTSICTYIDNRWPNLGCYSNLGFLRVNEIGPCYWVIDTKYAKRLPLNNVSKQLDPTSDIQLVAKIWDCGHSMWQWVSDL